MPTYQILITFTGTLSKLATDDEIINVFKGVFIPSYGFLTMQMITTSEETMAVGIKPMLQATTRYEEAGVFTSAAQ